MMKIVEKLGKHSQITIGCKNIQESFTFYEKLGFHKVNEHTKPYPWVLVTDDSTLIMLSQDGINHEYIGLTYFEKGMATKIEKLEKEGINIIQKGEQDGVSFASCQTPNGIHLGLVDFEDENAIQKKRTTLMDYAPEEWQSIAEYPNPLLGIFGELAIPVKDLDVSIEFWSKLGFDVNKMQGGPYPWAIGQDGQNIIGLHQTTDFDTVAMTYFYKEVAKSVQKIKASGVDSIEVFQGTGGGNENNVIITTPENQRFFFFNY